jgi:hypothetical protein
MVVQKMPVHVQKNAGQTILIQKMRVDQTTQLRWCDFGGCLSFRTEKEEEAKRSDLLSQRHRGTR